MLDSIYIGMTGLLGYSRGLRVIANNTANLNTPGFKGSSLQFGDLFYASGPADGGALNGSAQQLGQGLNTYSTRYDFSQGDLRQTGNDLDLAIDGEGLFTLRNAAGETLYTRDGEFSFDNDGVLVSRTNGAKVLGRDDGGNLVEIRLDGKRINAGKATATLSLRGNLSSTADDEAVSLTVLDASGGTHSLSAKFENQASTKAGQWKVTLLEGSTTVGSATLQFNDGRLPADGNTLNFTYTPANQSPMSLVFDFGEDVTSFAAGDTSTIAVVKQDGFAAGALTGVTFDKNGVLQFAYSNGQSGTGATLALARFESSEAVAAAGDNAFKPVAADAWEFGIAQQGAFGAVQSGVVEISNVDLSAEFSDLVIMQRGYQASSQVVSTANDMLQELFSLKGR